MNEERNAWGEVTEGVGEHLSPVWFTARRPDLKADGLGFMLGTQACGWPHIERIARWAFSAMTEHDKPLNPANGEGIINAYLMHHARRADHAAWLWSSLVNVHAVPADADNQAFKNHMLMETHTGWMRTAPSRVVKALGELLEAEERMGGDIR
jgi:hypothetical protein